MLSRQKSAGRNGIPSPPYFLIGGRAIHSNGIPWGIPAESHGITRNPPESLWNPYESYNGIPLESPGIPMESPGIPMESPGIPTVSQRIPHGNPFGSPGIQTSIHSSIPYIHTNPSLQLDAATGAGLNPMRNADLTSPMPNSNATKISRSRSAAARHTMA